MFGNDRKWPAAALAVGLLAFVWTGGAFAAQDQHQHDHGAAHDQGQVEEGQHDHSTMDHSTMDHGESHAAPETTPETVEPGQPAKTLSPDELDAPAETSVQDAERSAELAEAMSGHEGHGGHGGHGTGAYRQVDAGRDSEAGHESHQHQHGEEGGEETAATYVCPMHPEVTSATPAKCPKCGMDLVQRRKE